MKFAGIIALTIARALFFLGGAWQIVTLLPLLVPVDNVDVGKTLVLATIKILILVVCFFAFRWLGRIVNRLDSKPPQSDSSA